MNIVIIGAKSRSLVVFRGDLIRLLVESGHRVTAMAAYPSNPELCSQIEDLGATFLPFPVQRNGLNPVKDMSTFFSLYKIFRKIKPDLIVSYTIKPVIWGGFAAILSGCPRFYALITGLGFAFEGQEIKRKALKTIVSLLYRLSLRKAIRVIFQNHDNLQTFVQSNIVPAGKCSVVRGSGVNTNHYERTPLGFGPPHFLLIARLLREKGVKEYFEAAKKVKERYPEAVFNLLGAEDPSPDGVPLGEVQKWQEQGIITYLGVTEDVRPYLNQCHVYVLPSYHEGMSRSILEAMSTGRPILTTDAPGCRDTVVVGDNGYIVPVRDADALAERMIWFIEHRDQWERMGIRSREMVEAFFDVTIINRELLALMSIASL